MINVRLSESDSCDWQRYSVENAGSVGAYREGAEVTSLARKSPSYIDFELNLKVMK